MTSGECICSSEESTEINTCDNCLSTLPLCDLNNFAQELSLIELKVAQLACEQIEKSRNNQNRILSEFREIAKNSKQAEPTVLEKRDETPQPENDEVEDVYEDVEKGTPRYEKREVQKPSTPVHGRPATANNDVPIMGQTVVRDTSEESSRRWKCFYLMIRAILLIMALAAGYVVRAWLCDTHCRFCIPYPFSKKTYPRPF